LSDKRFSPPILTREEGGERDPVKASDVYHAAEGDLAYVVQISGGGEKQREEEDNRGISSSKRSGKGAA